MKTSTRLLAGSLAVNVGLIVLLAVGRWNRAAPDPRGAVAAPPVARVDAAPAGPGPETWTQLQTNDLALRRDRLQAEGFPPAVIRALIAAQVRESFGARRRTLEAAQADASYWKNPYRDPKLQAELSALYREEQKMLQDLLGPDPENGTAARLRRQFPALPAEKIDQVSAIRERYDVQRQKIYETSGDGTAPDAAAKLTALEQAMRGEFAAVLTPTELEAYDLRTSMTSNQLRNRLSAFNASEVEFRALYRLQSAFDDQFPSTYYGDRSEEQQRARSAAQKQLNDQIAAALGAERYADYQRATDYNYRLTAQLVARLELPPETAKQLYDLQREFTQRPRSSPPPPSAEAARQQAATLGVEAKERVTSLLGPAGYEAYLQYGGQWLQNLQPRPVPPPRN